MELLEEQQRGSVVNQIAGEQILSSEKSQAIEIDIIQNGIIIASQETLAALENSWRHRRASMARSYLTDASVCVRFEACVVQWKVPWSHIERFPRSRVMRPIERLDTIILALLLPCLIVGEELTRGTKIGLKWLNPPIVPQEEQFAFILWQWN